MQRPEIFNKYAETITTKVIGDGSGSGDTYVEQLRDALEAPSYDIAMAILTPIIVVEVMMMGMRIIMKQTIVDQFSAFTKTAFIFWLVLVLQYPQKVIRRYQKDLTDGGKEWGYQIAQKSPEPAQDQDPVKYWGDWLGTPNERGEDKSKYQLDYILKRIYGDQDKPKQPESTSFFNQSDYVIASILALLGPLGWSMIPVLIGGKKVAEWMLDKINGEIILMILMPFPMVGMFLAVTMAQIAGYMAPVMTQITLLVGSRLTLECVMCFGLAAMPFMFFQSMKDIWVRYLKTCIWLALVPMFYYITSGIGYSFSTSMFDVLFPPSGEGFGKLFKEMLQQGMSDNARMVTGSELGKMLTGAIVNVIMFIMNLFKRLLFVVGGTAVITAFVSGGCAFAAGAVKMAQSWDSGFSETGLMDNFSQLFGSIQNATSSSLGQGFGQATNTLDSVYKGVKGGISKATS